RPGNLDFQYAYRVLEKDQPIAWHPKLFCQSKTVDDWPKDARKPISELYDPSPAFTDLCIGGDVVIQRELKTNSRKTGIIKYHFVLRERSSHQVQLVSYRGYDSHDEAEKAFYDNFVWVVNYASDPQNYVVF